eukprot:SAG11_NODE_121_length_15851_cov_6.082466_12_plen_45_part_00
MLCWLVPKLARTASTVFAAIALVDVLTARTDMCIERAVRRHLSR